MRFQDRPDKLRAEYYPEAVLRRYGHPCE